MSGRTPTSGDLVARKYADGWEVVKFDPYDCNGVWYIGQFYNRPDDGTPEANARISAAAIKSYAQHFGPRAVEAAEADVLGDLIEAGQRFIKARKDLEAAPALSRAQCDAALMEHDLALRGLIETISLIPGGSDDR